MLASELIKQLQDVVDKQGDSVVWVDVPERDEFSTEFSLSDKWYQGNADYKDVRIFIVIDRL
jgi:hypothetical protein